MLYMIKYNYPPIISHQYSTFEKYAAEIKDKIKSGFQNQIKDGFGPWFPKDIPINPQLRDLISRCLKINTKERITAFEILEHPFILRE